MFKYTKDGHKVKVIGEADGQYIVKEVYITDDGEELISNKSSIVEELFDKPVKTWHEKRIEEIEQSYQHVQELYNERKREYKKKQQIVSEKIKYLEKFCNADIKPCLDRLEKILTGRIKYLVDKNMSTIRRYDEDTGIDIDSFSPELALMQLYGKDDGTLVLGINRYKDGSGNWREFIPCETKEEAVEHLKNLLYQQERWQMSDIQEARKWKIKIPKDKLRECYERRIETIRKDIEHYESILCDLKKDLKKTKREKKKYL